MTRIVTDQERRSGIILKAEHNGALYGFAKLPCPVCFKPILRGQTITPFNPETDFTWRHYDCERTDCEMPKCKACGVAHNPTEDCP